MIKSLQSLRGIFALMIFFHHYLWDGRSLFTAGGDCGVAFFMILSGFVLSAGYGERVARGEIGERAFVSRRLARIYPLHIVCLALFFIIVPGARPGGWLPVNLLLLQAWIPAEGIYFSGNAVAWCLSPFLFFYLLFPPLTRLISRHPRAAAAAAAAYFAAYFAAVTLMPAGLLTAVIYINPVMRLADFILGIALYHLLGRIRGEASTAAELGAVALLAVAIALYPAIGERWALASYWWIPLGVLIGVMARGRGLVSRLLSAPALTWLGGVSFSYYMIHNLAVKAFMRVAAGCGAELPQWAMLAGGFVSALLAAWGLTALLSRLRPSRKG